MTGNQHFEICVQTHFSAAHHLREYSGDCKNPHGHNWTVDVYIMCDRLNGIGIGIDFYDVENAVNAILKGLDHSDLNSLPQFQSENPSSENIARYLYEELTREINAEGIRVTKLRLSETPTCAVAYWED